MKKVGIIRSESWLDDNFEDISQILEETITEFVEDNEEIINIQVKKENNGTSRFWIYTKIRLEEQISKVLEELDNSARAGYEIRISTYAYGWKLNYIKSYQYTRLECLLRELIEMIKRDSREA